MHPARDDVTEHGACLSRRMLSGAGRLSIVAYANPELGGLEALAHHWSAATGQLLVAVSGPADRSWPGPDRVIEVRVQIEKLAVVPDVRVLTASVHALAGLRVLDEADLAELTSTGQALGPLAAVVDVPGVRLCGLTVPRVLLHAVGRVEQHRVAELMAATVFPAPFDELTAADLALEHGELAMARAAAAVLDGRRPGESVRVSAPEPPCEHLRDRVFPIDVSAHGLMMLLTGRDGAGLVTAQFDQPVASIADLQRALASLLDPDWVLAEPSSLAFDPR